MMERGGGCKERGYKVYLCGNGTVQGGQDLINTLNQCTKTDAHCLNVDKAKARKSGGQWIIIPYYKSLQLMLLHKDASNR